MGYFYNFQRLTHDEIKYLLEELRKEIEYLPKMPDLTDKEISEQLEILCNCLTILKTSIKSIYLIN